MKIRFLKKWGTYVKGEEINPSAALGKALVRDGLAESMEIQRTIPDDVIESPNNRMTAAPKKRRKKKTISTKQAIEETSVQFEKALKNLADK